MKPNYDKFYFNYYEQKLIARYYNDIKRDCREQWLRLASGERKAILTYRSYYMHPEKYDTSTHASMFIPQELLVLNSDIEKIRKYFTSDVNQPRSMGINLLAFLMQECSKHNEQFKRIFSTLMLMAEADDSNISFSYDTIGANITRDTIDIVDIDTGKSIATIKLIIN